MNIWIFLPLLIALITPTHAQDTINEEQILLNGYVDTSGKVLLTGYATPEAVSYMPFLNSTQYTFNNNTKPALCYYRLSDMYHILAKKAKYR